MPLIDHRDIARQHRTKLLQSVACAVGAGKTVAVRAATDRAWTARHAVIYLPDPTVGVRGISPPHRRRARRRTPASTTPPWPRRPPTRWPPNTPNGAAPPS